MSQGAEATQTLEASASTSTLTIEGRNVGATGVEVIGSYVTSKKVNAVASARRTSVTADTDTPALNNAAYTGTNNLDIGNSIHVAVHGRFATAGDSVTIFLALYDASDALIGITRDYTFTPGGTFTDGTKYMTPIEIIDVACASQVFMVVRSKVGSGAVDLYLEAL